MSKETNKKNILTTKFIVVVSLFFSVVLVFAIYFQINKNSKEQSSIMEQTYSVSETLSTQSETNIDDSRKNIDVKSNDMENKTSDVPPHMNTESTVTKSIPTPIELKTQTINNVENSISDQNEGSVSLSTISYDMTMIFAPIIICLFALCFIKVEDGTIAVMFFISLIYILVTFVAKTSLVGPEEGSI